MGGCYIPDCVAVSLGDCYTKSRSMHNILKNSHINTIVYLIHTILIDADKYSSQVQGPRIK
jgi:hypothetical protein